MPSGNYGIMKNNQDILNQYFDRARQQPSLMTPQEATELLEEHSTLDASRKRRVQGVVGIALAGVALLLLLVVTTQQEDSSPHQEVLATSGNQVNAKETGTGGEEFSSASFSTTSNEALSALSAPTPLSPEKRTADHSVVRHRPLSRISPTPSIPDTRVATPDSHVESSSLTPTLSESLNKEEAPLGYLHATPRLYPLPETGKGGVQSQLILTRLSSVNSYSDDYNPMITADGRTLYFVSDREHGLGGHDFWVASKETRNEVEFSSPSNLGSTINTTQSEGGATISADGQTMYFTACNREDGLGGCDIYEAQLQEDGWVEIRNVREINTSDWESQPTISADGRSLFFVSNRPGGMGGSEDTDIYVCYKQANGTWSRPRNLGAPINTPKKEDSPFIIPAGDALYFSSEGHKGFGGLDFFVSHLSEEGAWLSPANLGPEFNSPDDERFITIPAAEDVIYFTKNQKDGQLDLYMAQRQTTSPSIVIKGKILNGETEEAYPADLLFVDALTGELIAHVSTNEMTGEYSLVFGKNTSDRQIDIYGFNDSFGEFRSRTTISATHTYREYRLDLLLNNAFKTQEEEESSPMYMTRLSITASSDGSTYSVTAPETEGGELYVLDVWGNTFVRENLLPGEKRIIRLHNAPEGMYLARLGKYSGIIHRKEIEQ